MRYVIYGAGGIGGGIGGLLHLQGADVVLVARGAHLERIQEQGLELRLPEGDETVRVPAVGHPRELDLEREDVVLFCMKSQDTVAALEDLRAVREDVAVVSVQNGVANERLMARRFERVYGVAVYMPASFLEPGRVLLHGTPKRGALDAGRFPTGTDDVVRTLCGDLRSAGFVSDPREQVMAIKYGKLLLNLGNAPQALCGLEADLRELGRELRREARACFEAAAIDFLPPRELVERYRSHYGMGDIAGEERQGGSSWQSLERGLGSIESDFLNGEIALLGTLHGVPTPLNRTVQELAVRAAREGRRPGWMTPQEILDRAAQRGG